MTVRNLRARTRHPVSSGTRVAMYVILYNGVRGSNPYFRTHAVITRNVAEYLLGKNKEIVGKMVGQRICLCTYITYSAVSSEIGNWIVETGLNYLHVPW